MVRNILRSIKIAINRLVQCKQGLAATEFAIIAPYLILLYVGSFQMADAIAVSRKVTITTRSLADLASQYTSMNSATAETILKAAGQVMKPYSSANSSFTLSLVAIDAKGVAKVSWSRKLAAGTVGTGYAAGTNFTLSSSAATPSTSLVVAEVSCSYQPLIAKSMFGTFSLSDKIYMLPRRSTDIPFS